MLRFSSMSALLVVVLIGLTSSSCQSATSPAPAGRFPIDIQVPKNAELVVKTSPTDSTAWTNTTIAADYRGGFVTLNGVTVPRISQQLDDATATELFGHVPRVTQLITATTPPAIAVLAWQDEMVSLKRDVRQVFRDGLTSGLNSGQAANAALGRALQAPSILSGGANLTDPEFCEDDSPTLVFHWNGWIDEGVNLNPTETPTAAAMSEEDAFGLTQALTELLGTVPPGFKRSVLVSGGNLAVHQEAIGQEVIGR